jgi:hypothetical protein
LPALNFTVFVDKILSGEKQQTIRPIRKRPIKPGDKIYLYTGMRHKNCRKLGEAFCDRIQLVSLTIFSKQTCHSTGQISICKENSESGITITRWTRAYTREQIDRIVKDDGFKNDQEFIDFFDNSYNLINYKPKLFNIIKWRDFKPAGASEVEI